MWRRAVKKGDINGLSMAGAAKRTPVEKMSPESKTLIQQIAAGFDELWVEMRGRIAKTEKQEEEVNEGQVAEAIKKGMTPVTEMLTKMQEGQDALSTHLDAMEAKLKKSGQHDTPPPPAEGEENYGMKGIM